MNIDDGDDPKFREYGSKWKCNVKPRHSRQPTGIHERNERPSPPGGLCDNPACAVIPSGARNLALSILKTVRDSWSPAAAGLLGMTRKLGLSRKLP